MTGRSVKASRVLRIAQQRNDRTIERYAIDRIPVAQRRSPELYTSVARITGQDIHYKKLIARYGEMFDRGTALAQMNFEPARMVKLLKRRADEQRPAQ